MAIFMGCAAKVTLCHTFGFNIMPTQLISGTQRDFCSIEVSSPLWHPGNLPSDCTCSVMHHLIVQAHTHKYTHSFQQRRTKKIQNTRPRIGSATQTCSIIVTMVTFILSTTDRCVYLSAIVNRAVITSTTLICFFYVALRILDCDVI